MQIFSINFAILQFYCLFAFIICILYNETFRQNLKRFANINRCDNVNFSRSKFIVSKNFERNDEIFIFINFLIFETIFVNKVANFILFLQ